MRLFRWLDIETSSACNRHCATCIRNSNPNRSEVASWLSQHLLPLPTIASILEEASSMGFRGRLYLSHFNEPLLDPRIVEIANMARSCGRFTVSLVTNGDLLTQELAARLDGVLHRIVVSLYDIGREALRVRKLWLNHVFRKTQVWIRGVHVPAHFSPTIHQHVDEPCEHTQRVIINHRGDYLLCCEDMIGHFDLGRFPEVDLPSYWAGEKRKEVTTALSQPGGRHRYAYCESCPR